MTTTPRTKLPTEILTINEVAERFPEQWILLRVTDIDTQYRITAGQVMAVGKHSRVAWNKLIKLRSEGDHSHYYVFTAYPQIYSGEGWKEMLDNVDLSKLPRGLL